VETSDKSITIETIINSPVEKVWSAWTDPALILHWFGSDPNGVGVSAKLDVRRGGEFQVTFKDADQTEHTCSGVYLDVQVFRKLSFSWMWKSEPGVESLVTVSLTPVGNGTQMQFEHANLGNESKHNYLKGWESTFLKLEKIAPEL
jgi:uncharacterized protein YndB with AHSA1/START domain